MTSQIKMILFTGCLFAVAVWAVLFAGDRMRRFRGGAEAGARVWFYDQTAKRLYPAPRGLIPPDGGGDSRVRAMVVGFQGMASDASQLKIASLQKFSPEFKSLLERAEAAHSARLPFGEKIPPEGSAYYQENMLVKRPDETSWQPAGTPEAREIMAEWRGWHGPAGQQPIPSVPPME